MSIQMTDVDLTGVEGVVERNIYLCERGGHELKLSTTTSYAKGHLHVVCVHCRKNLTKEQVEEGYYHCPIDQSDYHHDCVGKTLISQLNQEYQSWSSKKKKIY